MTLLASASTFFLGTPNTATAAAPDARVKTHSCTVDSYAARCGSLSVPEDRITGKGRTIPVRFVVVKATEPPGRPDPVVWFAGGPGDSAVSQVGNEMAVLAGLNFHRDIVFIDQRGTGGSNPLTCPPFPGLDAGKAALRKAVGSCLHGLKADLRFYTSAMFVDDVAQVLTGLGYSKADLMGISYGVTAEQMFLLRHPGQVRTMVLLSGALLGTNVWEQMPAHAQAALEKIFVRCGHDVACHKTFPHIAADWANLWGSLSKGPWVVPAKQSPTHQKLEFTADALAGALENSLDDPAAQAKVPVLVHALGGARDHTAALLSVAKVLGTSGTSTSPQGLMHDEIMCAEPWEHFTPTVPVGKASFETRIDLLDAKWWQYACSLLPKSSAAVGSDELKRSNVPVLALNGEADPKDPPANMAGLKSIFPNGVDLVEPGQAHDVSYDQWVNCLSLLTQDFVQRGSLVGLDTTCVGEVPTTPFVLSLEGLAG